MKIKLKEAADLVGGVVIGNPEIELFNLAKIEEAEPGDLTFLYLPAYEKYFPATKASAILVKPGFEKTREDISYIETENPNIAFQTIIVKFFSPEFRLEGIDETAFVHPQAKLGKNVALGKNVVVSKGCVIGENTRIFHNTVLMENVSVGSDCLIFPNVSIREECSLGNRVIIHSGTVIGSDGFGYTPDKSGAYHKIPQIGNVVLEDDVELGSNVSIDRAAVGSTTIKKGCKIDNLVQIAHNVTIGENTVISAQTGVSGSTKIGKNVILTGQVGVVGHIEIADGVLIGAQSGVSKSINKAGKYRGSPALDMSTSLRLEAHVRNLPAYSEKIKILEEKIAFLENKISEISQRNND